MSVNTAKETSPLLGKEELPLLFGVSAGGDPDMQSTVFEPEPFCYVPRRWLIAFGMFWATFNIYALRVCLSVAIVPMAAQVCFFVFCFLFVLGFRRTLRPLFRLLH